MSKTEKLREFFLLAYDVAIKRPVFGARLSGFKSRLFDSLAV